MLTKDELIAQCEPAKVATESDWAQYEQVSKRFDELNLVMDDPANLMFSNHILCVIQRVRERSLIDPLPEEMFVEVSEQARTMSHKLLDNVFESEGIKVDTTEVLMVATHIQVALAAM